MLMKKTELEVVSAITDGIAIGLKNLPSLIVAAICYVLTIWIPYINVGTTIAMNSIPGRLAKGDVISPFFIFDEKYRRDFSAFFLLCAFVYMVTWVGFFFVIVPGIIISLSLSLATYILIDFDKSPTDAMKLSNQATYGHKWTIFFIGLLFGFAIGIALAILAVIGGILGSSFQMILMVAAIICIIPFSLGINAVIYKVLYLDTLEDDEKPVAEPETIAE